MVAASIENDDENEDTEKSRPLIVEMPHSRVVYTAIAS